MRSTVSTLLVAVLSGICLSAHSQVTENEPIKAGDFSFDYGKPWVRQAVTSSMRAGQLTYRQTDENLENVDVIFFYFGKGGGGGIQANIDRWAGQFVGEAQTKTEKKTVNDQEIIYFFGNGSFEDSMGGPFSGNKVVKDGYSVLGAILPSENGPVFLKMTGPSDSVEVTKDSFIALAESALKPKE